MGGSFFNWLKHTVLGLLVALPLIALCGFAFPWPAAEQALSRYPGQTPVTVAFFYHSKSWKDSRSNAWVTRTSETRSYVLLPSVFIHPKIVTVSQENNNQPSVTESVAPLFAVILIGIFGIAVLCILYFRARPTKSHGLSPQEAKTFYG
jgi:hypothetical protein